MTSTEELLIRAKAAVPALSRCTPEAIDGALCAIADALVAGSDKILAENALDVAAARDVISDVMIDRLTLTEERISGMAKGIREIAELPSPLYEVLSTVERPNGLKIEKISVPMGVIAIIYESRPNVTSDAAALALKAGSVCVLRGGKEAYRTSRAIVEIIREALEASGLPCDAVALVSDTTRESSYELMRARGYVDLLIPRGGAGLIRACVENSTVPCLETGTGICHIYVDSKADMAMALDIIDNAKTQRPSVCNAAEVCLVHKDIAAEFLPKLRARLTEGRAHPVELRCDRRASEILGERVAGETDFDTEFLDYVMALAVVDSVETAVEHISAHSTHHSEAIITNDTETAKYFAGSVDSAAVYVNASTRFTDGGEFGLGCEMGISTQKLHARGIQASIR